MNHIVLTTPRSRRYRGPSAWADLTARQYHQYLNWQENLDGSMAGAFVLFMHWYGMSYAVLRLVTDEQRNTLVRLLAFTDTPPNVWLLPRLRVRGWLFLGPGNGLAHLPFGAFMFAETALLAYNHQPDRTYLVDLAASVYAPKAWFYEKKAEGGRVMVARQDLTTYANAIRTLPDQTLRGIYLLYVGSRSAFPRQFPHLFRAAEGGGAPTTWLDVGLSLARQTGALGTFDEISQQPVFLVLTMLNSMIAEAEKLNAATAR